MQNIELKTKTKTKTFPLGHISNFSISTWKSIENLVEADLNLEEQKKKQLKWTIFKFNSELMPVADWNPSNQMTEKNLTKSNLSMKLCHKQIFNVFTLNRKNSAENTVMPGISINLQAKIQHMHQNKSSSFQLAKDVIVCILCVQGIFYLWWRYW